MGNSNNYRDSNSYQVNHLDNTDFHQYYNIKYNLTPSLPDHEYKIINLFLLKKMNNALIEENLDDKYIDLRNNFPSIINIGNLPFNPIASVVYAIHYSLLKNNLPIFQPSMMFIYHNIKYYESITNLFTFDNIFKAIKKYGICSEIQFKSTQENINIKPSALLYDQAESYKFLKIYKVDNNIELIKHLLKKKYPILIGFTVFYNIENIDSFMWMPNELDSKVGGLSGLIVGFIEDRNMFIVAQSFGECFGTSGFVLIPYDYILNTNYTFERYIIEFDSNRVENNINQKKKMFEIKIPEKKVINNTNGFENLFN